MDSRELLRRVIEFDHPPRIGMALPAPYPNDAVCGDDAIGRQPEWQDAASRAFLRVGTYAPARR